MKNLSFLSLIAILFMSFTAKAQVMGGHGHGVNPAAVLCSQKGGKSVFSEEFNSGEHVTFCKIGKAFIGQYTLLNQLHGDKTLAVKALLSGKVFTPKVKPGHGKLIPFPIFNCTQHGGTHVKLKLSETQFPTMDGGMCKFKDGSIIEEVTLYNSASDKDNAKLLDVLGK